LSSRPKRSAVEGPAVSFFPSDLTAPNKSHGPPPLSSRAQPRDLQFHLTTTNAGCPICPDFLRRLVALIHSMRLSLMKGAHVDLSSAAWQEIGVKPGFGLSGIPPFVIQNDFDRSGEIRGSFRSPASCASRPLPDKHSAAKAQPGSHQESGSPGLESAAAPGPASPASPATSR
jgi:hypothetical protein